ncbi:MAG: Spo0B domain-containing protein [Solibacillus sp.]
MKRFKLKLIIVLSILLVIFFIGISMYTSYTKIEDTVEEAIANQNLEAAKSIAKAIDLETYERFLKERNRDEDYWTIRHYLNDAREKLGVLYVYTLEVDNPTRSKVLIVGYPENKDNPNEFLIGEVCTVPEAQVKLAYEEGKPFVTEILEDTKYGHHYITVGTPIMNAEGEIISYLSIDISTDTLDVIKESVVNSNIALLVVSGLFIIIIIISFFLLQKWYQKEVGTTEYTYQKEIKTLMASVSSLRHDYINHIQVLHGFLHIGEVDQATKYVDSLSKDIQTIESIKMNLDNPGLAILLQTKKLTCQNQQIDIEITVDDNPFDNIKTIDLINILSNIIDNAIEATMELPEELRKITVSCKADELYYTFSITNAGRKLPDINQIFKQGYSTKKVEKGRVRGQGLFIVKETINKYNGTITLDTTNEKEIIAIVKIPTK